MNTKTAAIKTIAFCLSIVNAGRNTRRWFETDETIAPLLILVAQIAFLAIALTAKHAVLGVVKFVRLAQLGFQFYCEETVAAASEIAEDAIASGDLLLLPAAKEFDQALTDEVMGWAVARWPHLAA
ncbi:MAG: hypothetical protein AAGG53_05455 [Cyanobacteria bacterium P01_H01_bin.152]